MQALVDAAPKLLDYLGEESRQHFEGLQKILRHNSIPFTINPRLVRGLDYYNRSVFEWVTDELGTQGTICAGGRYDTLFGVFGGKPTPACGFAMGIERILELVKLSHQDDTVPTNDVYLVHQGEAAQMQAIVLGERLRDAGLDVILHCASANGLGNFKAQMKKADSSNSAYALIIGEQEVQDNTVGIKDLRSEDNQNNQVTVAAEEAVDYLLEQILGHDAENCDDPNHIHLHH